MVVAAHSSRHFKCRLTPFLLFRLLSCYSHNPSAGHYEAAKRVLAYLQEGTLLDKGIRFTQGGPPVSVNLSFPITDGTYMDANWGQSPYNR
jgi:hypothetical protein